MEKFITLIACILLLSVSAVADEVRLTNSKKLFPAEKIANQMRMYPLFAARLNPAGTHLIYSNMIPATPPDYQTTYEMKVLNVETAKKNAVALNLPGGYESVYTRFNFFNPAGDKLVMGQFLKDPKSQETEIVIYDLSADKIAATGIKEQRQIAMFDNTGKYLLSSGSRNSKISLSDFSRKRISLPGWVHTPSAYSPYAAVFLSTPGPERKTRLQLWNMETEKLITELPVHENNSILDDTAGQWTRDGRCFYYIDIAAKADGKKLAPVVRVWDAEKNCQIAEIFDAFAVGPGPTKTTMLMVEADGQGQGEVFIHDAKTDELIPLANTKARPIHTCGNKLAYIEEENGEDMVYIADISIAKNTEDK